MVNDGVFICESYITISPLRNGLFYPIFRLAKINVPYFQIIDKENIVREMVPLMNLEEFFTIESIRHPKVSVNSPCIIAFRALSGGLIEGDVNDVSSYFEQSTASEIEKELSLLTRLQLSRFLGKPLREKMSLFKQYGDRHITRASGRKLYEISEINIHYKTDKIWSAIDNNEDHSTALGGTNKFSRLDTAGLFLWLTANIYHSQWQLAWIEYSTRKQIEIELALVAVDRACGNFETIRNANEMDLSVISILVDIFDREKNAPQQFIDLLIDSVKDGSISRLEKYIYWGKLLSYIEKETQDQTRSELDLLGVLLRMLSHRPSINVFRETAQKIFDLLNNEGVTDFDVRTPDGNFTTRKIRGAHMYDDLVRRVKEWAKTSEYFKIVRNNSEIKELVKKFDTL